ncbi:MAG: ABC transporter substrate-binding protein [Desulfobacterales bacterium]|nr:ABC transporter substrate-binding protein [Desulfobacterales bacterium]
MPYKKILFIIFFILILPLKINSEEGVTDTEIRVAQFGPLTGPASPWSAVLKGAGFLFDLVNSEGGIHGRKIVYRIFNDDYNPAKTKFGVKELQEKVGIFAWIGGIGTETSLSVKDYLMNRKIPWISPFSGSKDLINPPNRYLFAVYPLYSFEAKVLCNYAIKNLKKTKIAIVYQNDGYGKSGLEGVSKVLAEYNMSLVAQIPVISTDTDMKSCALELQSKNADAVLLFTTTFAAFRILKISKDMHYFPQWMGGVAFNDHDLMYKISNGLWQGAITNNMINFNDTTKMRKYREAFKKAFPNDIYSPLFHAGVYVSEIFAEALTQSGRNLTRERLIEELEKMNDFQSIAGPKITFKPFNISDPECRRGTRETYLTQCLEGGKTKRLTNWISDETMLK